MLHQQYSKEQLSAALARQADWRPFPTINDRESWDALPADIREQLVSRATGIDPSRWPPLPATLYLEYARNGNRSNFEAGNSIRRSDLSNLVLAECCENQGRRLDPIADGIWRLCEESSWCLPAHTGQQAAGVGLPDPDDHTLDLFAGETGALLAWTEYLLGDKLDQVSPMIRKRLQREVDARVLQNFLDHDTYGWQGFRGNRVNNWNPWINSNVIACALILEPDHERRVEIIAKAMRSIDNFLDPYPKDGGCDEGPGYWGRAGASLFDCLELLYLATDGTVDLYKENLVREIGRFIYRVQIADRWFINFADAPARLLPGATLIYRYGQRLNDEDMQAFAAWILARQPAARYSAGGLLRAIPGLFCLDKIEAHTPAAPPLPQDVWLPEIQVMVARNRKQDTSGLTLAAKGGHNAESHNHNDVGHFIVYSNGCPAIIDVGVERYRRQTFSPDRYQIWTMQSQYHSLPTINGVMQAPGLDFAAADLVYESDDERVRLQLSLANAYPDEARIKSWEREFVFVRGENLTVTDRYELHECTEPPVWHLMTAGAPEPTAHGWRLLPAELPNDESSGAIDVRCDLPEITRQAESVPVDDKNLQSIWGETLHRLRFEGTLAETGAFTVRIQSSE